MLHKSRQYAAKCTLLAFVFCETLLISAIAKPLPGYPDKKWVVVIDAGHGGKDPGCHGIKYKEKDVALAVALKLGQLIQENNPNVKVIYTRSTDVFIPLNERADIANRNHADFFICIHCNASPDKTKYGSATYVMASYKSEGNLEVSKRENSSVLYEKDYKQTYSGFDPNSNEANILFAMYQNAYLSQSLDLSAKIQKEYVSNAERIDNGVKQAGFLVLWKTTMPSLLTEMGFLTNPQEELFIGSHKGQTKIAESIFFALQQYMDEKEGVAFNAGDFKLPVIQPDSAEEDTIVAPSPDTSSKIVRVHTEKTQVKNPKNASSKSIDKMKQSVQVMHPDSSVINKSSTSYSDSIAKIARKRRADSLGLVLAKRRTDSIARTTKKRADDSIAYAHRKKAADSLARINKKRIADSIAAGITAKAAEDTAKIVYKVQIAISSKPLAMDDPRFKGVSDVGMYIDKSIYKYTSGHFSSLGDAVKLQSALREQGFKDAFVIALKGNARVPVVKGK